MLFRMHTAQDHRAIAELRWLLKTIDEPVLDTGAKIRFLDDYAEQLRASDVAGDTVHWVAELQGSETLVGALTIRSVRKELSPGKEAGHWGYLTNVFVREDYRDQGHGSALLEAAVAWSRAYGLELLVVWPSERSYSFYRRVGFVGRDNPLTLDLE